MFEPDIKIGGKEQIFSWKVGRSPPLFTSPRYTVKTSKNSQTINSLHNCMFHIRPNDPYRAEKGVEKINGRTQYVEAFVY